MTDERQRRPGVRRIWLSIATVLSFSAIVIKGVFPIGVVVLLQLSGEGSEAWRPRAWIAFFGVVALGVSHCTRRRLQRAALSFVGIGSLLQYVLFAGLSDQSSIEVGTSVPFFCLVLLELVFWVWDLTGSA